MWSLGGLSPGELLKRTARESWEDELFGLSVVVTGLAGLRPRPDSTIEIDPLLPRGEWDWFSLDRVPYHGRMLTIIWDRTGARFHRGKGFAVYADGREIPPAPALSRITGEIR